MFVVQRAFSRVRRGYDPDEVDRHLELVSQWFTSTDIGRAFTHERAELDQRERAVAAKEEAQARDLEGARLEAEATLEGARRRADGEARAADQALAAARQEAAAIRADADRQRTELLEQARAEAAAAEVIRAAEERAAAIVATASEEAERVLAVRVATAAEREREQRLAAVRAEAAELAERLREEADEELRVYTERRRREADRLAQAARRGREAPPSVMDSRRFTSGQLVFLIGAPLAWALLLLFHAAPGPDEVYASLRDDVTKWQIVHVGTLVFLGLMGVALWLLVRDLPGRAAQVSRLAIGPFVLFYGAGEALLGIGTGVLVRHANTVPTGERGAVARAIDDLWDNSVDGEIGVLLGLGALAWIVAVLAAALAYRRLGAPLAVSILLAMSAIVAIHAPPVGPVGLACFALAAALIIHGRRTSSPRTA